MHLLPVIHHNHLWKRPNARGLSEVKLHVVSPGSLSLVSAYKLYVNSETALRHESLEPRKEKPYDDRTGNGRGPFGRGWLLKPPASAKAVAALVRLLEAGTVAVDVRGEAVTHRSRSTSNGVKKNLTEIPKS